MFGAVEMMTKHDSASVFPREDGTQNKLHSSTFPTDVNLLYPNRSSLLRSRFLAFTHAKYLPRQVHSKTSVVFVSLFYFSLLFIYTA